MTVVKSLLRIKRRQLEFTLLFWFFNLICYNNLEYTKSLGESRAERLKLILELFLYLVSEIVITTLSFL